jgi:hypothetical protein
MKAKYVKRVKPKAGTFNKFCSSIVCPACKRVGCWMNTDDPLYIQCKCGEEKMVGVVRAMRTK